MYIVLYITLDVSLKSINAGAIANIDGPCHNNNNNNNNNNRTRSTTHTVPYSRVTFKAKMKVGCS